MEGRSQKGMGREKKREEKNEEGKREGTEEWRRNS